MIQTGLTHPVVRIWIKMTQDYHYDLVTCTQTWVLEKQQIHEVTIQTETLENFGVCVC